MKRIGSAILLLAMTAGYAWSLPKAQRENTRIGENQREARKAAKDQQKINRKMAKSHRKAMKKYQKSQRRAARRQQGGR